jgi:hypothetical protein
MEEVSNAGKSQSESASAARFLSIAAESETDSEPRTEKVLEAIENAWSQLPSRMEITSYSLIVLLGI